MLHGPLQAHIARKSKSTDPLSRPLVLEQPPFLAETEIARHHPWKSIVARGNKEPSIRASMG